MCKISFVILFLFSIHSSLIAQTKIDLPAKLLEKELSRINGDTNSLSELATSSEVASQVVPGRLYAVSALRAISPVKYAYVGRVKTCRTGGCSINNGPSNDKESEYFDYLILFDSTCTVRLVKIYNYQATHGQEITAKSWLKQFIGYNGDAELTAGKNVDAISGATISVNAINTDIEYRTGLLKQAIKM